MSVFHASADVPLRPLIYFIRHGQTDWNVERRLQGHIDIPINAYGRGQARRNGVILCDLIEEPAAFDYLSSPLMRASQTMEIIRCALGLPHIGYRTDDRLKEISFGAWAGRTSPDIREEEPDAIAARDADPWLWSPPEGECYRDFSARVLGCFGEITKPTVMVAHGGVMRILQGHVLNVSHTHTVHLDVPQDKVMMIENSMITWF